MKKSKKSGNLALIIIVSVILVIMTVALVNVGMTIVKERPKYNDYCRIDKPVDTIKTESECNALNGEWQNYNFPVDSGIEGETPATGYCDLYHECNEEYDQAQRNYNQLQFYLLAAIGFILLLFGLHTKSSLLQYSSLGSGGILFLEGVVINFENKIVVFISLLVIIAVFGYFAKRIIEN